MQQRLVKAARETFAPEIALKAFQDLAESPLLSPDEVDSSQESFLLNLAQLLIISPPMQDSLRRHPEWFQWLRERVERRPPVDVGATATYYQAAWETWISDGSESVSMLEQLRAFKRRELLEIAYLDIAGLASFEETVQRLSCLAERIIDWTLRHCWESLGDQQQARFQSLSPPEGFAIFALGKFGGNELNYSSDIDLVFLRRPADTPEEVAYFTRLGERLVHSLSQPGTDGFLYRVDLRLRPLGETGPLVPSLTNLVNYYESWGEAWERQALVKARFITGDQDLGRRFSDFIAKFTFARAMDDSSLEEIKRVKHRSEREYALGGGKFNVKQGLGGIRDIEFYVQFLQLIAGSERPELRTVSTLEALRRLGEARLLLEGEESQLSLSYRFLRIVEHRLQLRALTPSAILPEDPQELAFLALGLGFDGEACAQKFRSILEEYRLRVRLILDRIYLTPGYLYLKEREEELAKLLTDRTPRERVRELLSQYGFGDIEKAWQNLRLLALGPSGRILPPGERRAFLGIAFTLLEVLRDSLDPDQALHHLESFATASGNRISFLRALASRRPHLERLSNLLALSGHCHQVLTRHPEYFDSLARGIHMEHSRHWEEMYEEIKDRLASLPGTDAKVDLVRKFRQREMIRIAYRDLAKLAGSLEVSCEISELAEACLAAAVDLAEIPQDGNHDRPQQHLQVVALGKFGSRLMHYSSDLDLMFLYEGPSEETPVESRAGLQRTMDGRVERILHMLAGVTSEGVVYRVDLRLRPEGASGLLARSWNSFEDYSRQYMQPWERMALVRSRILAYPEGAADRWKAFLDQAVYEYTWDLESLEAVRRLKRRIETEKSRETRTHLDFKYGRGGVADLEFLVQFLQIQHGKDRLSARIPSVDKAIAALQEAGGLSSTDACSLLAAHRFQRQVENHYQLMEEWTAREISRESPLIPRLARSIGIASATASDARKRFLSAWDDHAQIVRGLVERYFYSN